MKTLLYNTRDGQGNDIVKEIPIKERPTYEISGTCPICNRTSTHMCKVKDCVSAEFTDWACIRSEYVCKRCAELFSLHFYNYIVDPSGIRLLNVRQLKNELVKPQNTPFLFVISTSQKKHLFYRSVWNYDNRRFAVNLETETIFTTPERMKELFDFVECCQTLGSTKEQLKRGVISQTCLDKNKGYALKMLDYLRKELDNSREIQIPLYCGQKREITEEEALCCLNLTLKI